MSESAVKTAEPGERKSGTRPDVKVLPKEAIDLLIRLHVVIKNAKIYEANNEMFQEQARLLYELIDHFLKEKGEASFQVRQSALFFNGVRFKFVLATYPIYKFILEEFRSRNVGFLAFLNGLTTQELVRFAVVFGKRDKKEEQPFPKLIADLEKADVGHVIVRTAFGAETFASTHEDTARMFFLGIIHLKEIFEREKKNEGLPVNTTRRLMQSIFNHIVDDESFLIGLTNLKNYDEYTLNHSVNVCVLSLALGRRLGLSRSELVELGIAAFFHDLGKLETPLDILNKPATLSQEEREIMEQHPHQGAEKLIRLKEFRHLPIRAIHVALEHHIREDLTGYPSRLRKEDVNLFSKIVKVVDYFDALTTKRVYRAKAFTRTEALGLMLEQSGTEFNPVILKAFVNLMGVYPIGTMVALTTGELGIVADVNPEAKFMLRPKVKLIAQASGDLVDGDVVDLSERDLRTGKFPRTIVKVLNPAAYGVEVSDYFLAQAR
jgi:HD-GYP domain-containing protein (c-di-GMP phosphodiesterase class II)